MVRIITLSFILFYKVVLAQQTYYVSPSGLDTNSGTFEMPFKTISAAAAIMQAGDVCMIRGGVYRETVIPKNSGTIGNPITFTKYQNETVIITGTDIIENWVDAGAGKWKAQTTKPISDVFSEGDLVDKARYPNIQNGYYDKNTSWAKASSAFDPATSYKTGYIQGMSKFGGLDKARAVIISGAQWHTINGTIIDNVGDNFRVYNADLPWSNMAPQYFLGEGRGFITDHIKLLDAPNEWHYQNNELYIIAKGQANPNTLMVEGRVRDLGFDLTGLQYINLTGLHFKAARLLLVNAIGCNIENCSFRYITPYFYFRKQGFNRTQFEPDVWEGKGIEVSGSHNLIQNCYIAHSWGDGLTIWGSDITVNNCIVEDCNWLVLDSAPIHVQGDRNIISNNTLRTAARSVLVHRNCRNAKIINNDISNGGLTARDLGLIYTWRTDGQGTEIAYNWLHDNKEDEIRGIGIYLDNFSENHLVHHNVIWNCYEGLRMNLSQINSQIYNNTFWNTKSGMRTWGQPGTELINCKLWNNIQDQSVFQGNDLKTNLYSTNSSMFVDPVNGDFRLKAGAQAIDYGTEIPGITDGFTGAKPDAGAYELGASWTAGANLEIPNFDIIDTTLSSKINQSSESDSQYLVYPNPVSNSLIVDFEGLSNEKELIVVDIHGKTVLLETSSLEKPIVNVSTLKTGIYFLKVVDDNGLSKTVKFIKI